MKLNDLRRIDQLRDFLERTLAIAFSVIWRVTYGATAMSIRLEHSQFDTFSSNFSLAAWHILSAVMAMIAIPVPATSPIPTSPLLKPM